jgi:hypothetical protein
MSLKTLVLSVDRMAILEVEVNDRPPYEVAFCRRDENCQRYSADSPIPFERMRAGERRNKPSPSQNKRWRLHQALMEA